MSIKYSGLLSLLILVQLSSATFSWGRCPSVPDSPAPSGSYFMYNQGAFDASSYLGTWNNMLRNKDFTFSKGNCTQAYYHLRSDNKIAVVNSEIVNGQNSTAIGVAEIDTGATGELLVKFSLFSPWANYIVAYTDYENSSLVFSCFSVGVAHWKWAWILTRSVDLQIPNFFYDAIEDYGIPLDAMETVIQANC